MGFGPYPRKTQKAAHPCNFPEHNQEYPSGRGHVSQAQGQGTWDEFLKMHAEILWQIDFFSK